MAGPNQMRVERSVERPSDALPDKKRHDLAIFSHKKLCLIIEVNHLTKVINGSDPFDSYLDESRALAW